jgi:solute carrier family 9B (sodium/hydrogen exchanger), member 1/2
MLASFAFMIITGFLLSSVFQQLKLPKLIGMLVTGILLGPYVLDVIAPEVLMISLDLRYIALTVIVMRAGLSLNLKALQERKKEVLLLSFIPATIEIIGALILGPVLLDLTVLESLLLGTILAAVSPAIIVPKMLDMIKTKQGTKQSIPQMILASASLDDIYVIVLFTSVLQLTLESTFEVTTLLLLPVSLLLGILSGVISGALFVYVFKKIHMRDTIKALLLLSIGFLMITLERLQVIPYSGLIGILSLGMTIYVMYQDVSKRLVLKYEKIWIVAELLLFILIGAAFDLSSVSSVIIEGILFITGLLVFRFLGVWMSLSSSNLHFKEKVFVMLAFIPKATVQASIASIPLSLGVSNGNIMLSVAVLSIFFTAPLGALLIDMSQKHLTQQETISSPS